MGKGQRSKNIGAKNQSSANFQKTYEGKAREKSDKLKRIALIAGTIAVALFLIGMTIYNAVLDSGVIERKTVAVSSENFEVDNAMMSYYFREQYNSFLQNYSSMISYLGIDTSSSLKSQSCTMGGEGINTWYDFFLAQTKQYVSGNLLVLCEGAKEAGISLDDEDKKTIDDALDSLEDAAKEAGLSKNNYMKSRFGLKIKESDIRRALELSVLASKYSEQITGEADVSDEALEAAFAENPTAYEKVSYRTVTFDYKDFMPEDESEAETTADTEDETATVEDEAAKKEAMAKIAGYANELMACEDEQAFTDYLKSYMTDVLKSDEATVNSAVENSLVENASYTESDEKSTWAFSAKVGDKKEFPANDGETITVLYLTSEHARQEEHARNVRHILFKTETYDDAEAKAREVYDKWIDDGASLEDFEALVKEYSEDTGSVANGGLYENVREGEMDSGFNDWLFNDERVEGDHGLAETSYGWHIMYYPGEGETIWKLDVKENIQNAHYEEVLEKLQEEKTVNIDDSKLDVADIDE